MTQYLPVNLFALFAPREPISYLPPPTKLPHEKRRKGYSGLQECVGLMEKLEDAPPPVNTETHEQRRERKRKAKLELSEKVISAELEKWEPNNNPSATEDAYKTLFVARINYDTAEHKLRREFETYGRIKSIKVVKNAINGRPRGYAFIEYERESDMHDAYRKADGRKIDGRRVVVDVERGRTVKEFKPRRLGGGLGGTRREATIRRSPAPSSYSQNRSYRGSPSSTRRCHRSPDDNRNNNRSHRVSSPSNRKRRYCVEEDGGDDNCGEDRRKRDGSRSNRPYRHRKQEETYPNEHRHRRRSSGHDVDSREERHSKRKSVRRSER